MFSGKTSEIIRIVHRESFLNKQILLINSKLDERYSKNSICSHNQIELKSVSIHSLKEIENTQYASSETIIIDEAQFFNDLYEFVIQSIKDGKKIFVVGLNGDAQQSPFGQIHLLLPHIDTIKHLTALCHICKNGTPGIFSKKIKGSCEQTDIGSSDKYIAVCRECYQK